MYSGKEGAFVLKMVRWHRQKKNNGNRKKRIASAVCMLGVLVVCLGVVGYRNKLKADEKLPVMTRGCLLYTSDYRKKNPPVHKAFAFRTPEHAVEDGYIRDKEAFASALKAELSRHDIHEKEVVFTLSSAKVVTLERCV